MEILEALMYSDDSICVKYCDGSALQLSPCGSVFTYQEKTERSVAFQQLTRFAISLYKEKVCEAVSLRNKFACQPYLCKEIIPHSQLMISYKAIEQCSWPLENLQNFVKTLPDGTVQVQSIDGFAVLTLMAHMKSFVVTYLAKVQQAMKSCKKVIKKQISSATEGKKSLYTWIEQVHSVRHHPVSWKYPLELALHGNQLTDSLPTGTDNVTDLPVSLPLDCGSSHLHRWHALQVMNNNPSKDACWQPNLKILWRTGNTYRIYRDKLCSLEVTLADGSFLSSQGYSGKFFTHSFINSNSQVEERVYSAAKPPPEKPGQTHSVTQAVTAASRILQFLSNIGGGSAPVTSCWNRAFLPSVKDASSSSELVDSYSIPNLGKFTAYSSGHIRITFADRTLLSTLSPRRSITTETAKGHDALLSSKKFHDTNVCQLILPNGSVHIVPLNTTGEFERYTRFALQWLEWISCSSENRKKFCEGTVWDANCQRSAQDEIEKIQRFNYIVENCALSKIYRSPKDEYMNNTQPAFFENKNDCFQPMYPNFESSASVNDVLMQTAQAIQDIEMLLSSKQNS